MCLVSPNVQMRSLRKRRSPGCCSPCSPAFSSGTGLVLGQLRQAGHQGRSQRVLQGERRLPGHEAGRDLTGQDLTGKAKVVVVNEAFARRYLGNRNPLGRRIGAGRERPEFEIVGVAKDSSESDVRAVVAPAVYWPFTRTTIGPMTVAALAEAVGVSRQSVNELLHGRRAVSPEMALRLARLFGNSPEFWHAAFVLTVGMVVLPGLHPPMVSEHAGPKPNRHLQPPGFLALNYGQQTPFVTLVAHLLYGALLGGFYSLS